VPVADICGAARISLRTFYRWRRRLGGLTPPALARLKKLERENQRLRELVRELSERGSEGAPKLIIPSPFAGTSRGLPGDPRVQLSNRSTAMLAGRFAGTRLTA
jgi:putative transposase